MYYAWLIITVQATTPHPFTTVFRLTHFFKKQKEFYEISLLSMLVYPHLSELSNEYTCNNKRIVGRVISVRRDTLLL
jgi:hypothetical protein